MSPQITRRPCAQKQTYLGSCDTMTLKKLGKKKKD